MPRSSEALVTINGVNLSNAQSIALRMAVLNYLNDLINNGLGDDEVGKALTAAYIERLKEIEIVMHK